ncbi:MAG: ABC transporter ATP-binding protein [Opitutales bacterium]|nr:ABC transporter ATP-binding protein [Opitutales bacterium]
MNESIIELKNISKCFNDHLVLDGVNLHLSASETISVIGASGTGKTTLLNIISLLESPDEGEVYWENILVSEMSSKLISRLRGQKFGYVFQNHNLVAELSVLENILLPIKVHGVLRKTDIVYAKDLLAKVGLLDRKDSQIEHLSGGEKQRIAIARAIINRPQVILADEPTGNLDEKNARVVIDLMFELCKSTGSSLVLITHNNELARLTDKTYLLCDGHLAQQQDDDL